METLISYFTPALLSISYMAVIVLPVYVFYLCIFCLLKIHFKNKKYRLLKRYLDDETNKTISYSMAIRSEIMEQIKSHSKRI